MFRAYYRLIKPRVMYGNLITTVAGFLFAANGNINWSLFAATIIGTSLVISSACVINNYLDQDIDALMDRTKSRPLITGQVSGQAAIIFGTALGLIGLAILILLTNLLVTVIGILGWIVYVWLYGALGKRKSVHGTLVGSISGAAPILAGYVAVTNSLDVTGALLFAILFFWQMPEFYSISIFRRNEYAKANIPVSAVVRGVPATKRQIFAFTLLTVICSLLLIINGPAGWIYFVVMLALGIRWLQLAAEGLITRDDSAWARRNFNYSLIYLVIFSLIISINPWLP
ncbi:MAG: heme o synthase [bacterium]|nr:heme o synthase [bacterium]